MHQITGLTISDESISLDGKHFVDCILVNCILSYSGQQVVFERTHLQGCRHVFYGEARSTVHYLQNMGLLANRMGDWQEFADQVN